MHLSVSVKTAKGKQVDRMLSRAYKFLGLLAFVGCSLAVPYLGVTDDNFSFMKLISLCMGAAFGLFLLDVAAIKKNNRNAP
jgi:hypothetical protein